MSTTELAELVLRRRISAAARIEDLFDLAEYLRSPESIDRALEDLPRVSIASIANGTPDDRAVALALDADDLVPARIAERGLLDRSGGTGHAADDAATPPSPPSHDDADAAADVTERRAAETAFTSMSSLAELLRAVDDGLVRELAKGGIGGPLARSLAETAGSNPDDVVRLLGIAVRAGLVDRTGTPWSLTADGRAWIVAPWTTRWTSVVRAWHAGLRGPVAQVLATAGDDWRSLDALAVDSYPAASDQLTTDLAEARADAAVLGIVDAGVVTATGRVLLDRSAATDDTERAASSVLPETVPTVYLQADLTVIAPGPLAPADDDALRQFARLEAPGLAARYRISDDTIRRAFRNGLDRASVLATLERLGGTAVPQPLRYLIDETAARDASITVDLGPNGTGTALRGTPEQLDLIGVDAELRHLGWRRPDVTTLVSRSPLQLVMSALEEQRYPAVLASAARPRTRTAPPDRRPAAQEPAERARVLAERLLAAAESDGRAPEQEWIGRQVDLAARERSPLRVVVRMPDASERVFTIIPTAVAGGRVRGREVGADVERTLPLSLIVRVEAG